MKRKGKCEFCFSIVKSGGDRHGKGKCNMKGPFWQRRPRTKKSKDVGDMAQARGAAVAGVHKRAASAPKTGTTKK